MYETLKKRINNVDALNYVLLFGSLIFYKANVRFEKSAFGKIHLFINYHYYDVIFAITTPMCRHLQRLHVWCFQCYHDKSECDFCIRFRLCWVSAERNYDLCCPICQIKSTILTRWVCSCFYAFEYPLNMTTVATLMDLWHRRYLYFFTKVKAFAWDSTFPS